MNQPSTHKTKSKRLPPPVTARGQRTRQKLLDAAELVFGRRGFENTSIAEITQKAGVALGTFYVYFPHKEAIFVELVDELGKRIRGLTRDAVAGETDRLSIERAGFRAFLKFAATHPNLYRVVKQAEYVAPDAFRRYYENFAVGYVRGLETAMRDGQIRRMNAEALAYALMGIADFVGMRFVMWGGAKDADLEALLDQIMEFVARGMELSPVAPARKR